MNLNIGQLPTYKSLFPVLKTQTTFVEIMLSGKITGTVTNAATGWLLPLAIVSITDSTGTTQTITTILSGTFTAEIPAGVYTVTVIKPWYLPYSFIGSVSAGETSVTNVPLTPSPPTISNITVTDIAENSAKINWTTDQLTEGRVEYGKTNAYGATASDSIEGTAHSITLASLSPATNYHFRVIATSANGTSIASNDGTFKTIGHIDITINSPAAGASINSNSVIVTGSIANAANIETGVTVNGVAAALINNQFAINNVPLTEGQNTITVTATDTNGTTATKSIIVNAANIVNYIKLSAYPESGAAPMEVTLRINGTFSIANPVITSTGPGTVEQLVSDNPDEFKCKMTTEGVYYFTAQATGPDGNTYSDTLAVTVHSLAQLDTLLRSKWALLTSALQNKDIATALTVMLPASRDRYQTMFSLLTDQLPAIVATQTDLVFDSIAGDFAFYELKTSEAGSVSSYRVIFVRDTSTGLWLIQEF